MIHQAVKNLLDKYSLLTAQDYENALKEIIQQAVLAGLWRSNFFNNSAFLEVQHYVFFMVSSAFQKISILLCLKKTQALN